MSVAARDVSTAGTSAGTWVVYLAGLQVASRAGKMVYI